MSGQTEIRIAVATGEPPDDIFGSNALARDVELVKAAILYADHVTLLSPGAAMVKTPLDLMAGDVETRRRSFVSAASVAMTPEERHLFEKTLDPRRRSSDPEAAARLAGLDRDLIQMDRWLEDLAASTGMVELASAEKSGLLTIDTLGFEPVEFVQGTILEGHGIQVDGLVEKGVKNLYKEIAALIGEGGTRYPLFDDSARAIATRLLKGGAVLEPSFGARQGQLAGYLVGRIPTLGPAPMDEILDIRRALDSELVSLRAAVIELGSHMTTSVWDKDFPREAEEINQSKVRPKLDELSQAATELGIRPSLGRVVRSTPKALGWGAATLLTGVAATPYMSTLAAIATAAAPATALARYGWDEIRFRDALLANKRANQFLFLYEAGRKLGKSRA